MNKNDYSDRFTIYDYRDVMCEEWDNFVLNNSMGYAYHLYEVMKVDQDDDITNLSFCIFDSVDRKIVLLMPLYLKSKKACFELISRKGVVIKDNMPSKLKGKLGHFFISYMDMLLAKYRCKSIYTEMSALSKYSTPERPNAINPLIFLGFSPRIRYTWVVNISKEEHDILADCEQTTRQSIRRYSNNDDFVFVETNELTREKDCEEFICLSEGTYRRSQGRAKSKKYYRHLFMNLMPSKIRVFFIRDKTDNAPIATAAVLIYNDTAKYFLGASVEDKPIGINKFLIYRIMIELKKIGIIYFETGGAYPYLRDTSKRKGMSDFKKSFGTYLHLIHMGIYYSRDYTDDIEALEYD